MGMVGGVEGAAYQGRDTEPEPPSSTVKVGLSTSLRLATERLS